MAGRTRRTGSPSRQQTIPETKVSVQIWQTAIYARLSVENSGKDDQGASIEEQVSICKAYIEQQYDLTLTDTYMDNGWSGTNTDRPEFQRMLNDLRKGRINAVVVKDFSRFSRNYIEAGTLFEREFPALGVRFISVNDRYDSLTTDGSAEGLLIPLKNMINSYYSADISKKVSTLGNPTYTGDLVFGRYLQALYLGKPKTQKQEESQWLTLPNMHEPLVERDVFERVQQISKAGKSSWHDRQDAKAEWREANQGSLLGYVYCGDCGYRMKYQRHPRRKELGYYSCQGYVSHRCDNSHCIPQDMLKQLIWDAISSHMPLFCDLKEMVNRLERTGGKTRKQKEYEQTIRQVLDEIKKCKDRRMHLYDDFSEGILSPEEYVKFKQRYEEELEQLSDKLRDLQAEQHKLNKFLSRSNRWLKNMLLFQDCSGFDSRMLEALVERINVYRIGKERRVEILLKYSEDFDELVEAQKELKDEAK